MPRIMTDAVTQKMYAPAVADRPEGCALRPEKKRMWVKPAIRSPVAASRRYPGAVKRNEDLFDLRAVRADQEATLSNSMASSSVYALHGDDKNPKLHWLLLIKMV